MPREQLRELQLERMKKSIRHAYDNVDFYKKSFAEAGVTPDDLTCLEDLAKFPFVVKQDMRDAYPFGLFAVPKKDVARIHASSGTTGQATVVGHTANDIKNWGDCFARGIYMVGGSADSTVQVSYGYGLFTGGLGAHYGAEAAGCSVIPTSSGNTKRQIQMMVDLGTDILCCTPSYALYLADTAISMGYDPAKDFKLSAGIFGAEPCSQGMRDEIAEKLGVEPEFIEGEWDGLLAGLDAGRYDIMVNGVDITEERAEKYDFSEPYAYNRTAVITKGDNDTINSLEDLKDKKTANTISSTYAQLAEQYGADVTGVDDLNQTFELLNSGRIDATLNAEVTFYDYTKEHPDANVKIAVLTQDANEVAIPLRKGDETATLREAINTAIDELRASGQLKDLSEKYFGTDISSND